ncbi:hypothetical protein VNO77_33605 [Canavalia gladiata]|uniref:Short-chain dehydrogenase TIC 32, chloroplastic-like n=1 Tax=Canavalia gladiata TaxID=3824 RepID=A0AAN9KF11_CANGL
MWPFSRKGTSGFSSSSTAEEVTYGIDATGLTAIVTALEKITEALSLALTHRHYQSLNRCSISMSLMWASSGIGAETTRVLAMRGVHVIMGVRNLNAAKDVKEAILEETPTAKVDAMELDLSSMASVRKFASEFNASNLPLNILIYQYTHILFLIIQGSNGVVISSGLFVAILRNNAGIFAAPFMLSKDNIELQFATNHMGHFLLTSLLLDTMKKTAHENKKQGRIINVSSSLHRTAYREGIHFDKINDQSSYHNWLAYGQSKLANILHANELARCLKEDGIDITANSIHPGAVLTNVFRHTSVLSGVINMLGRFVLKNVQQGAATTCYVALHPQVSGISGEYFVDSNLARANSQGRDIDLAKKLWDFSLNLIK